MDLDKDVLEGIKYQDLVKLAKEYDVYRRYAPKAELIERLMDLKKAPSVSEENNILSDISMPSLDITDDEIEPAHTEATTHHSNEPKRILRSKDDKANKSGIFQNRSILTELNQVDSPAVRRTTRKTVGFVTPKEKFSATKVSSSAKKIVRISTPGKPVHTPVVKSSKKAAVATSTPAANSIQKRSLRGTSQSSPGELDSTFTFAEQAATPVENGNPGKFRREGTFDVDTDSDKGQMKREGTFDIDTNPGNFRREGTFEIVTVDDNGKRVSQTAMASSDISSPFEESRAKRTRFSRSIVSTPPVQRRDSELKSPSEKTPANLSVKELCRVFEEGSVGSMKKTPSQTQSPTLRRPISSPQVMSKSARSPLLRSSFCSSSAKPVRESFANMSLPSTARKAFVTDRQRPGGYIKPPSKRNSISKGTPKVKTPSVIKEIQMKQQAVSAKKMMEASRANKSKILQPRKIPNFGEMHAKMYSKMESLVDAKQKVLDRAQEYGSSSFPRCAVVTPKFFSAEKPEKFIRQERADEARPPAARQLKLPANSKLPQKSKDSVDAVFTLGTLKSTENGDKSSQKHYMPPNRLISRLPVLKPVQATKGSSCSATSFNVSNNTRTPRVKINIAKAKETVTTKAPVSKVQDVANKGRTMLRNVRTNKRFELQMQHRMKSQM